MWSSVSERELWDVEVRVAETEWNVELYLNFGMSIFCWTFFYWTLFCCRLFYCSQDVFSSIAARMSHVRHGQDTYGSTRHGKDPMPVRIRSWTECLDWETRDWETAIKTQFENCKHDSRNTNISRSCHNLIVNQTFTYHSLNCSTYFCITKLLK